MNGDDSRKLFDKLAPPVPEIVGGVAVDFLALDFGGNGRNRGAARVLSAAGYMVAATAAYLGGDLVFKLGLSVNRNAWVSGPKKYANVASVDQLREDVQPKRSRLDKLADLQPERRVPAGIGDTVRLERFNSAGVDLIAAVQEELRQRR